jgi:hypothetical protein
LSVLTIKYRIIGQPYPWCLIKTQCCLLQHAFPIPLTAAYWSTSAKPCKRTCRSIRNNWTQAYPSRAHLLTHLRIIPVPLLAHWLTTLALLQILAQWHPNIRSLSPTNTSILAPHLRLQSRDGGESVSGRGARSSWLLLRVAPSDDENGKRYW